MVPFVLLWSSWLAYKLIPFSHLWSACLQSCSLVVCYVQWTFFYLQILLQWKYFYALDKMLYTLPFIQRLLILIIFLFHCVLEISRQAVKQDKTILCEDWRECIEPLILSGEWKLDRDNFGVEQYFSAKSLVSSRSFEIDDYHGYGMVPLADL